MSCPPAARLCSQTVASLLRESPAAKEIRSHVATLFQGKVGSDFADYRRKLEAVPGKPSAQDKAWMVGMPIEHKMAIRRERIETWFG